MKSYRSFLMLVLLLSLALTAGCGVTAGKARDAGDVTSETPEPAPAESSAPEEDPVPADWDPDIRFSTVDMEGNTWTDGDLAAHELTIINLWAYWCPPCVGEMPDLQRISEDYASKGVQMLGISMEDYESSNRDTISELGITYPCLRYTEDFDAYMQTGYIPTTIFVDRNGKVLGEAYVGGRDYSAWAELIEEHLK